MADVFLSYARANQFRVEGIARALESPSRSLWWDRRLAGGDDYALVIERELDAARAVVVAWSAEARDSLWVRAEANAALDQGKLVQVSLDAARLPLPFTMLHSTFLGHWMGGADKAPFPELVARIDAAVQGKADETPVPGSLRPEAGGAPFEPRPEGALQGFSTLAAIGWAAIAAALLVAIGVLMTIRGAMTANLFNAVSIAALIVAVASLGLSSVMMARIAKADRR